MSHVHLKNGSSEKAIELKLWHKGIRYRKNFRKLPGSPDIAITKYKIAVFIDGEFWHGKDWLDRKGKLKRNRDYWIEKIEENMARDRRDDQLLKDKGWITLHFWEKDVKKSPDTCVSEIIGKIPETINR